MKLGATTRRRYMELALILLGSIVGILSISSTFAQTASGPLRTSAANPLYFTDGAGKTVYLGGTQVYDEFSDYAWGINSTSWTNRLSWFKQFGLNLDRAWIAWFTKATPENTVTRLMPYKRVPGSGKAYDGGDKFDLDQFDQAFFDNMYARLLQAQDQGLYILIMLFDRWSWALVPGFIDKSGDTRGLTNVFHGANNINGIHWDYPQFFTTNVAILAKQKDFVRKVIDTVNPLDNVMYEIANEAEGNALAWHQEIASYIKTYEATKPKQHPVYASTWANASYADLRRTGASVISLAQQSVTCETWKTNPPYHGQMVPVMFDEDHTGDCVRGKKDYVLPWRAFLRGFNYILYDEYDPQNPLAASHLDLVRYNVGKTVEYATRAGVADMTVQSNLASTGFALAKRGEKYLVLQSGSGPFSVSGLLSGSTYSYEWYNPVTRSTTEGGTLNANAATVSFSPPFGGSAVLYLRLSSSTDSPSTR